MLHRLVYILAFKFLKNGRGRIRLATSQKGGVNRKIVGNHCFSTFHRVTELDPNEQQIK